MKCKICNQSFGNVRSLGSHTTQRHHISTEEYYKKHINSNVGKCVLCNNPTRFVSISKGYSRCCGHKCAKLLDNQSTKYREKISMATRRAMKRPDVRQRFLNAVSKPKSTETIEKMSRAAKLRCNNEWKRNLYTSARNQKISKAKTDYWKSHPEEKQQVGKLWQIWKSRDEIGWRKHLRLAAKLGFEKIMNMKENTSLEIKMYSFLESNGIEYNKQYELGNHKYDAYLPAHNVLVEFDGEFWHKNKIEDCQYDCQKVVFYNDRRKDEIAKKHNIPLIRIRETESPEKILETLKK